MSNKNTTVSLTLQVKGNAGQALKRIADDQVKAAQRINSEQQKLRPLQEQQVVAAKKALEEMKKQGQALVAQKREALAVDAARKLGFRTEQQINNEIKQTRSNYAQLSILQRQGVVSAKDMERAYAAMKARVATLNGELGKTVQKEKQIQQIQKSNIGSRFQTATALGGAATAGGIIVSNALQKPRDYAQQMTYITATATGGQGLNAQQRLAKSAVFEGYVKDAVRTGGGTREDVAAALNELIASGKYDESNVAPALLASSKTAFAAGADTVDAAKMTLAMQNFGVKDLSLAQDRSMRAGQVGSFEYKDMAKFLPEQMAMARASGYSGDAGLVKLLSLNQVAKTTASDSNTAGNNVVNLLQKLSSREFSDSISKTIEDTKGLPTKAIKNKKGKVVGQEFDWATYSIDQRGKGVYGVEAFVKLLERQLQGNAQYSKLQKEAQAAKTPEERKAKLEDMSNIAMGSEMGQIIADRQALMAAMAAVYNKDKTVALEKEIGNARGTVDADLSMIKGTEWAKDQALGQEKLFAQSKSYDALTGPLSAVKDGMVDIASKHEGVAAAAYSATVALTALAAGAGVATVLGGGKGGMAGKVLGGVATAARAGGPTAAVAAAGAVGYGAGTLISKNLVEGTTFGDKLGETIAKTLAVFGNDGAKEALEAQAKYDAMIAQQEQTNKISQDMVSKISTLINVTAQNKPLPMPFASGSSPLMQSMNSANEEKRHGAPPAYLLKK
ncbi:MAG: phage tail tape measure protein [Acinetobacter sp.]